MRKSKSTVCHVFLKPLLCGTVTGSAVCVILLLVSALIATIADIPHALVVPLSLVAVTAGTFVGSFVAAGITKHNGWLIGMLNSIVLFILSIISGWSFFESIDTGYVFIKLIIMLFVGVLSGIIAVNSGKRKRK